MLKKDNWDLVLVNPTHSIPNKYPINLKSICKDYLVDERIISALSKMINNAYYSNCHIGIFSAYRSIEKQIQLVEKSINKYISTGGNLSTAREKTFSTLSLPGFSEHHTGLAIDVYSKKSTDYDNISFQNSKEYIWLINNSYKYGFILRYPKNKVNITNISFEPWHFRYVGTEASRYIYRKKICLEDLINSLD